ncbi:hypothetical protein BASA83_011601 [Batrachochytrium salamandrivorans]|nr:hypothetical protein BASA83_011601 [Batrachochytrium salamandrivorans]
MTRRMDVGSYCTMPLELYSGVTAALRELFPDMARAAANTDRFDRLIQHGQDCRVLDPLFATIHSFELGGSSLESRPLISRVLHWTGSGLDWLQRQ